MGNALAVAAAWLMYNNKRALGHTTPQQPSVAEEDFTGKVAQTNTVIVTKPTQLPMEHMRNGMHDEIRRKEHEMDVKRVQDTMALLAQQQPQATQVFDGNNPFSGHLVPAACSYGEKCRMAIPFGKEPPPRAPCTQR